MDQGGGPGAQFVGICNSVYALTPDRSQLYRFDRYSGAWTQIGGPADAIIRGGSKVYASAPSKSPILWCEALTQTSCVPPLIFDSVVRKTFPLVLQFFLLLATIHRAGNDQNEAPDCEFLPVTEMTKKLVRCLGDVLWRDIGEPFALRHTLA